MNVAAHGTCARVEPAGSQRPPGLRSQGRMHTEQPPPAQTLPCTCPPRARTHVHPHPSRPHPHPRMRTLLGAGAVHAERGGARRGRQRDQLEPRHALHAGLGRRRRQPARVGPAQFQGRQLCGQPGVPQGPGDERGVEPLRALHAGHHLLRQPVCGVGPGAGAGPRGGGAAGGWVGWCLWVVWVGGVVCCGDGGGVCVCVGVWVVGVVVGARSSCASLWLGL